MGSFVQDTALTPVNAVDLGVNNVPPVIEIPVDVPEFYSFALKFVVRDGSGTEFGSMLTDW